MSSAPSPWAVVLAGGVGSRFWPLSTPSRPKQLLPLVTSKPLVADAIERLSPIVPPERTLVLTIAALTPALADAVPGVPHAHFIAEPRPAGTAAALAWGALEVARRSGREDTVMISVHADWAVRDAEGFRSALQKAIDVATTDHRLVTVGVVPTRPETGYGYIRPGRSTAPGISCVDRFVEKPDAAQARELIADGCLWNSGIFVWRAGDFLQEIRRHTPEVAKALDSSGDSLERFFAAVDAVSVDQGVLERSDRVSVIPGDFGWDDVGTWDSLHRVRSSDDDGNTFHGEVHGRDSHQNVVHAEDSAIVLYGVDNLVVVARAGLVLVTTRERSADLKNLLESLPDETRDRA